MVYEINENHYFPVKAIFGQDRKASYLMDGREYGFAEPTLTPKETDVSLISIAITNALLEAYNVIKSYDEKVSVAIRNTKHRPTIAMLHSALADGRTILEKIESIKPEGTYSIVEENCKAGCMGPCGNCHKPNNK